MQLKFHDIVALVILMSLFSACNDKICPAYSSYFILDNSNRDRIQIASNRDPVPDESYNLFDNPIRDEYFSYLAEDSMPKEVDVEKTWYGTAEKKNLNRRNRDLQTIPMEVVIPEPDDSALFAGDEQMFAEMEVDSLTADSLAAANAKTYKYNVDQKYYLWYFRNKLVWEDELDSASASEQNSNVLDEEASQIESDTTKTKKKGLFKGGLFGKKKNQETQETEEEENPDQNNDDLPDQGND